MAHNILILAATPGDKAADASSQRDLGLSEEDSELNNRDSTEVRVNNIGWAN
jgi:hypothetical protein